MVQFFDHLTYGALQQEVPCFKLLNTTRYRRRKWKAEIRSIVSYSKTRMSSARRKNNVTGIAVPILLEGTGRALLPIVRHAVHAYVRTLKVRSSETKVVFSF